MVSRVHKYRAWVKKSANVEKEVMVPVIELEWDYKTGNNLLSVVGRSPYGLVHDWELKIEDVELMEFTGLLDKNKVEIYEKDLIEATRLIFKGTGLETTDHILEEKILFEVDYIQGAFLLSNPKKCILLNALFCDKYQRDVLSSSAHYKISDDVYEKYVDFKRIGNIFENTEYLEE